MYISQVSGERLQDHWSSGWFSYAMAQLYCKIIDDGDDAGDDVVILRKGRGRPRGSDWRREYECPTCQKCFAQKGEKKYDNKV